ncbi:MATH and LRR domain-containing protein PFE0570w-like isoform X2 [Tenebrio molitor]|uniref:MATH and LRR domain-containing protein PFE0570w-like isoform X2 n=1 Tax=Tenebrio molitor TaxID=7067 RepID=UPI0036247C81
MNDWSKSNDSLSPQLNRHSRIVTLRDSSDLSEFSLDQGTSQTGSRLNNHHFDVIALHPNNEDNPNDVSSSEFLLDLANRPDQANNQTGGRLNNQRDHDFENTQVDPGNNNEDRVYEDMTFEQVEDTDLTPKESFIFMLGMLNRIEKYSETLIDGVHGKWYKNNIAMVKIVLIKSYSLFKSENLRRHIGNKPSQTQVHKDNNGSELKKLKKRGVKAKKKVVFRGKKDNQYSSTQAELNIDDEANIETLEERFGLDKSELRRSQRLQIKDEVLKSDNIQKHNGSLGIDDTPSQTQIHEVNNSSELKKLKKRCVKAKKKVVSNGKSDNQCSSTEVELNTDDQENTKPPEKSLGKSEPRRSQRLQIDDREVFSDRLEYVDLKLAAATFTPLPERLNKSLSAKQRTVKRKSRSSCGISSKRGRNSGKASLNSTVPTSSQENVTLGTVVNKSRQSSQACKRLSKNPSRKRAKSLDLKSRNGKGGSGTQDASPVLEKTNTLASTSSTSLFDKRNLYSVDSWLDSFP